jgi:hypothetical protein
MSDTNVHRVVGNLLVGTSHFFVDTTTNQVGINTSSPSAALDVATGDVKVGSGITLASSTGTITATGGFSGNGSGLSGVNSDSGSWVNGSSSNIHLAVSTDNVGIGVLDPSHKLDVDGDINIATGSTLKVGGTPAVFSNWSVDGSDIYRSSGNVGIGTNNPQFKLHIGPVDDNHLYLASSNNLYGWIIDTDDEGNGSVPLRITKRSGGVDTEVLTIKNQDGKVGVGTNDPGQNLHVHEAGSGQVVIAVTNDTTGGGNNDGIHFGLDASENGFIWHKQNTELQFATNNTKRVHITGSGLVHHANSQKYNFHWNPSVWGYSTNVSGNDTNLWAFVLNVPYDGWIFVKCNAHWAKYNSSNNDHVGGNSSFYAWISVANRTPDNSSNFDSHTGVSNGSYDRFHEYQSPDRGGAGYWRDFNYSNFYKVSAGNNTISLRVENHFGGGSYLNINGSAVSGFYIPKNYL